MVVVDCLYILSPILIAGDFSQCCLNSNLVESFRSKTLTVIMHFELLFCYILSVLIMLPTDEKKETNQVCIMSSFVCYS